MTLCLNNLVTWHKRHFGFISNGIIVYHNFDRYLKKVIFCQVTILYNEPGFRVNTLIIYFIMTIKINEIPIVFLFL